MSVIPRSATASHLPGELDGSARKRGLRGLTWFVLLLLALMLAAAGLKLGSLGQAAFQHWSFTRPALDESAQRVADPRPDPTLQQAISAASESSRGVAGVYVWDLAGGASAGVDEDRAFSAASLAKLPVLIEVLRQERLGKIDDGQMVTIKAEHWADGAGVLQAQVGRSYSVGELNRLMISDSDNIAARVLTDLVGADSVNASMRALGLTGTHIEPIGSPDDTTRPAHVTSARDVARLLALIASGGVVDRATSERALSLLESQQANNWLAAGLPWWARVAHKWGDLPGVRHDAGIVYSPRGRYVVAVLTEGMRPNEAALVISRVSRAAFDRLGDE